jgi:glycosyltransferase involved in cell wall biosynthesis
MHGVDFHHYLPPAGVPVLATLHLPIDWYPAHALDPARPDTWFNCVSVTQHGNAPRLSNLLPPIENGVALQLFARHAKRGFALMLGRICPEKGVHIAIDAAKRADVTLLIGGEVFAYEDHRRYFEEEIRPRLDARRRFLGPVGLDRKRRLLAAARCLLIPSLAEETSSLVAREALAAGTPVVAFDRGALCEAIEHGRTGYLVRDVAEMAEAIPRVEMIDPDTCRLVAQQRFSSQRMVEQYLALYHRLAAAARSGENSCAIVSAA